MTFLDVGSKYSCRRESGFYRFTQPAGWRSLSRISQLRVECSVCLKELVFQRVTCIDFLDNYLGTKECMISSQHRTLPPAFALVSWWRLTLQKYLFTHLELCRKQLSQNHRLQHAHAALSEKTAAVTLGRGTGKEICTLESLEFPLRPYKLLKVKWSLSSL